MLWLISHHATDLCEVEGLAKGGEDVVGDEAAVKHKALAEVVVVLGNVRDHVIVLVLAASCEGNLLVETGE